MISHLHKGRLRFRVGIATLALSLACLSAAQMGRGDIVSSNAGVDPFSGININTRVGANTFYSGGYNGSRSIVANIEAGLPWNGHETLAHQVTRFWSPGFGGTQLGQDDRHATWVGSVIGGRLTGGGGEYQRGIAYGSELWAGAVATTWVGAPFTLSFNWSNNNAFLYPYKLAMLDGIQGRTADVINSSWGYSDPAGSSVQTRAIDGLIWQSHKVMTASAGNSGPGANTIGGMASGYNVISVGATGSDTSNPTYNSVSSFSSRSPSAYSGPDGSQAGARARIDIVAPGQDMTLAYYGGATGGNLGGVANGGPDFYSPGLAGTSFAAPTVAGGAALLVDAGKDKFGGGNSIDGRVIKSVLQTSADKLPGWNNGQAAQGDGSILTTQALDFAQGAGQMNLTRAYDVYTGGTTDVAGNAGGSIQKKGWDIGTVSASAANDYFFSDALLGGSTFTATLNWFVHREFTSITAGGTMTAPDLEFSNLDLELYTVTAGVFSTLVAKSDAAFINTEHFSLLLPTTGMYGLRVNYMGARYNLSNDPASEVYAMSWLGTAAPVPEPASILAMSGGLMLVLRRRRRKA